MNRRKQLLGLALTLGLAATSVAEEAKKSRIGDTVPLMFHSIAVTGPRKGTDVCWV